VSSGVCNGNSDDLILGSNRYSSRQAFLLDVSMKAQEVEFTRHGQAPELKPVDGLRVILLSSILFVYSRWGVTREIPPMVIYVQGSMLALLSGWWAWKVLRNQRLASSPLALPAVALIMASVVTTLFSVDPRTSLHSSLGLLTQVLLFFLVCDLLLGGWSARVFTFALCCRWGWCSSRGLGHSAWHWKWWKCECPSIRCSQPHSGFSGCHASQYARSPAELGAPFAILGLGRAGSKFESFIWGVWLLAADFVLFFTNSRSGWVAAGSWCPSLWPG